MELYETDIDELMERIINNEQYEKRHNVMLIKNKTRKQLKTNDLDLSIIRRDVFLIREE